MASTKAILGSVVLISAATVVSGACSSGNKDNPGNVETNEAGQVLNEAGIPIVEGGVVVDNEAGVECGRNSTPCPDGAQCTGAPDCASSICTGGVCVAPSATCGDGTKDGTETDVDCGGGACPGCVDGKACGVADDCLDDVCTGSICQAPTCTDTVKNGAETGTDCGGGTCPACGTGQGCVKPTDCTSGVCTGAECAAATCTDTVQNGDETGVDCGGSCATKCAAGQGCVSNADCNNLKCDVGNTNKCLPASPTDGFQNGDETDVDCGGATTAGSDMAPACGVGKKCVVAADCTIDACDYTGHCPIAPSCAPQYGGNTCGEGETGSAAAGNENHESCCASIPLLNNASAVSIDKYEITAGRVRQFITAVDNDVYDWYQTYKAHAANPGTGNGPIIKGSAVGIRTADEIYLPTGLATPTVNGFSYNYACTPNAPMACNGATCPGNGICPATGRTFGVWDHLGNTVFYANEPSDEQGCYVANGGSFGHPTYWWDDATQSTQWGAGPRAFTQQQLDEKSLNCVPQILLAAFCAWDGGRLPTSTELYATSANSAWGAATYPWGATPSALSAMTPPAPYNTQYACANNGSGCVAGVFDALMPLNDGTGNAYLLAPQYNTTNWNPFYPFLPGGLRYYYPPVHGKGNATGVGDCTTATTNCGWGQTDEAYEIAPPGRFINDKRPDPNAGMTGTGLDGWFDLAANMMEVTSDVTGGLDGTQYTTPLPITHWMGGSFEGHPGNGGPVRNPYNFSILTKYGKQGGRCAR